MSWLLFYFQAAIVLHLHKNYFILSLFTILIIAIGHARMINPELNLKF